MKILLLSFLLSVSTINAQEYSANYLLTFIADWTSTSHPLDFPNGAHFSGLIGNTHNDNGSIWNVNQLASDGIEQMAETGSRFILTNEINNLVNLGHSENLILGSGANAFDTVTVQFDVSESHPSVSVVTMIAPSPDWFLGISSINLMPNGFWENEIRFDLLPYDSGTDNGETFNSLNSNTNPPELISRINTQPFANNIPLGEFVFTLQSSIGVPPEFIFANGFE